MESLIRAATDFLAAILSSIGFVGRPRRRAGIREDIELLTTLRGTPSFGPNSRAHSMLVDHITTEIARLAGVELPRRRQVPWSSVVMALVIGAPLGYWTYKLNQNGFVWYSLFPGVFSALMAIGVIGMISGSEDASEPDAPAAAVPGTDATT